MPLSFEVKGAYRWFALPQSAITEKNFDALAHALQRANTGRKWQVRDLKETLHVSDVTKANHNTWQDRLVWGPNEKGGGIVLGLSRGDPNTKDKRIPHCRCFVQGGDEHLWGEQESGLLAKIRAILRLERLTV